jgi:hypothetical protein
MTANADTTAPARFGPVEDIVRRLDATAQNDRVTVGDVVEAFGPRSFLPLLMVPAIVVLSPLSGVPPVATLCGLSIMLVAGQMLWPGRDHLWLPERLQRRNVSGAQARRAVARLGSLARWLDTHARGRLRWLVTARTWRTLIVALCFVAGAAMPVFELVPFTASILGLGVLLMATGLLARDGLFALIGVVVFCIAPLAPLVVVGSVLNG